MEQRPHSVECAQQPETESVEPIPYTARQFERQRMTLLQVFDIDEKSTITSLTTADAPAIVDTINAALQKGEHGLTTDERAAMVLWLEGNSVTQISRLTQMNVSSGDLRRLWENVRSRLWDPRDYLVDEANKILRQDRTRVMRDFVRSRSSEPGRRREPSAETPPSFVTVEQIIEQLEAIKGVSPEQKGALTKHFLDVASAPSAEERALIATRLRNWQKRLLNLEELSKRGDDTRPFPTGRTRQLLYALIGQETRGIDPISRAVFVKREPQAIKRDHAADDHCLAIGLLWLFTPPRR